MESKFTLEQRLFLYKKVLEFVLDKAPSITYICRTLLVFARIEIMDGCFSTKKDFPEFYK